MSEEEIVKAETPNEGVEEVKNEGVAEGTNTENDVESKEKDAKETTKENDDAPKPEKTKIKCILL